MTVYFTAQVKIKNREAYDRYASRFMEVFSKFKGTMLAADFNPTVLAGNWDRDRLILMSFPDEAALMEWLTSEEYKEIGKDRDEGAEMLALLVPALELPQS
ncbi:DUF1330 domain-containing protein [Parvularcula sp. IMCC14364]|uniref:DUF1330 domain-containing protein n=1 Tax=Parvularcula sp. IMCC14364 TaxID=3067902 RepID=UPI00274035E6|nr:DUF1330 domain-containing protein [Parvularcula sp. IMCC14364]